MSYSHIHGHRPMIFDDQRNSLYAKAIHKYVNKDSVVLDLGAGLGLHGLLAAKAGARRIYLVEPEINQDLISRIAAKNNLQVNIQYLKGKIQEISLPEPVDIIISVFTGNYLLEEDLIPSLFYARNKYLKPGGVMIPDFATMEVAAVSAPDIFEKNISVWSGPSQQINFDLVRGYAANNIYYDEFYGKEQTYLSEPVEILIMDFHTANKADCKSTVKIKITNENICHGFLGWFKARLGDDWLSTAPHAPKTHWRQAYLPLDPPVFVKTDDILTFNLQRHEYGEWTWSVEHEHAQQKHSTFLSQPFTIDQLQKKSDICQATLSNQGQIGLYVLKKLDGNHSTLEIANEIADMHPDVFPDVEYAKRFVIRLIERFT